MKKIFFVLTTVLFLWGNLNAQDFKYALITSPEIGQAGADTSLVNIIDNINLYQEIQYVVITGNLTARGTTDELDSVKTILNNLSVPYYVIPGDNDMKWSESAGTEIAHSGFNHFFFEKDSTLQAGLNSTILWRDGGGHFSPEEIRWFADSLKKYSPDEEIFLYSYFPFNSQLDNWYKLTNQLLKYRLTVLFTGSGKSGTTKIENGIFTVTGISAKDDKGWGYSVIENKSDSLKFYKVKNGISKFWTGVNKVISNITETDSSQFKDYSEQDNKPSITDSVLWQTNLNATSVTNLLVDNENIFAVTDSGTIYCFDKDGNKKWIYNSEEKIVSKPVREGNLVAFATLEGDLISLSVKTGEVILIIGIGEPLTSQLVKTKINYNGKLTTGIIVATEDGKIYCYDLYTFELIWENDSPRGLIRGEPLVFNHRLFISSQDGFLYSIDDRTGALYWKWTQNLDFYTSPVASHPLSDGSYIYITTPDKNVTKIDMLLGISKWRQDYNSWESLGLSKEKNALIIKSISNKIYFASTKTGKRIKEVKMDYGFDLSPSSPVEWKGNYLYGFENGFVYVIGKNYKWKKLFFMGNARINSIEHLSGDIFVASNMDGKIVCFKLNK